MGIPLAPPCIGPISCSGTLIKHILSSVYCCGSPWLSGAVMVMVDAVVDVLCASRCVVCVLLLRCPFLNEVHIWVFVGLFLSSDSVGRFILSEDFVSRFCRQNFPSTFNEPSAKPTRVRALGTHQCSRARLIITTYVNEDSSTVLL
jgi:hypothetical protein